MWASLTGAGWTEWLQFSLLVQSKQKKEHDDLKVEVAWCRGTLLRMLQEKLQESPPEKLCPPTVDTTTAVDTAATESTTAAVEECRYYYRYDGIC